MRKRTVTQHEISSSGNEAPWQCVNALPSNEFRLASFKNVRPRMARNLLNRTVRVIASRFVPTNL
jgi:hypothetical protein